MLMKEKILITGASGFAGKSLSKYLKKKKFIVTATRFKNVKNKKNIKIDLTKKIFLRKKFDWIIHAAAHHKIKDFSIHPKKKKGENILMVKNLINFSKQNEMKNFIYFSTIDINYSPYPIKKQIYCSSKNYCEKILRDAFKKKIFDKLIILRLPAIVGKNGGDNFVKKTIFNLKKNLPINTWNMNIKYNNLVHVNDLNKLIYCYCKNKTKNKKVIIDCLSSSPIKLKYLIYYLKRKLKSKSKISFLYKKNKYKKIKFNPKVNFNFSTVKKAIDLLI